MRIKPLTTRLTRSAYACCLCVIVIYGILWGVLPWDNHRLTDNTADNMKVINLHETVRFRALRSSIDSSAAGRRIYFAADIFGKPIKKTSLSHAAKLPYIPNVLTGDVLSDRNIPATGHDNISPRRAQKVELIGTGKITNSNDAVLTNLVSHDQLPSTLRGNTNSVRELMAVQLSDVRRVETGQNIVDKNTAKIQRYLPIEVLHARKQRMANRNAALIGKLKFTPLPNSAGAVVKNQTSLGIDPELIGEYEPSENEYFRPQPFVVNRMDFKYLINSSSLCADEEVFLLIMVCSLHENFHYRQAIRDTWGSITKYQSRIKLVFLLGRHKDSYWNGNIQKESVSYRDIVYVNFAESYKNLTIKVLSGIRWALKFCKQAAYLLKADEDMVINVPYLIQVLVEQPLKNELLGSLNTKAMVMRTKRSKWGVSNSVYPFRYYPPYLSGNSYVMPHNLSRKLISVARMVPLVPIEDAFITGILTRISNVTLRGSGKFTYWGSPPVLPCEIIENKKISGTHMTPQLLYKLWTQITKKIC